MLESGLVLHFLHTQTYTHMRGEAASATATGRVKRLHLADYCLQLTNQLLLGGSVQLGLEMFEAINRDGLSCLWEKDVNKKRATERQKERE